jgi:23S rRNA G2069 N7-methylase RlmK/C1962 C5-methylase RlmI
LLDCFTYTGAFAVTLAKQCDSVTGVDMSGDALSWQQPRTASPTSAAEATV